VLQTKGNNVKHSTQKHLRLGAVAAVAIAATLSAAGQASANLSFSDNFDTGASPAWNNAVGNWNATGGVYGPASPGNYPPTYSGLPFTLTDFTVSVENKFEDDSGIWLRSDGSNQNGVLFVMAHGYIYFHTVENGQYSSIYNIVSNPYGYGSDFTAKVVVTGNTYDAFVNGTLIDSFTTNKFSSGEVGLYSNSHNSKYDNFSLSAAPEPATWSLMILGIGGMGAALRTRRRKVAA